MVSFLARLGRIQEGARKIEFVCPLFYLGKPQKAESIATKNLSDFQLTETSHTNLKINE
jgi:hypothetical protein